MNPRRRLIRHGLVLFLLGIVTGLAFVLGTFVLSTSRAPAASSR